MDDGDFELKEMSERLDEIEAAMARLDSGTYGTCETCGGAITDDELSGQPARRTCSSCRVRSGFDIE